MFRSQIPCKLGSTQKTPQYNVSMHLKDFRQLKQQKCNRARLVKFCQSNFLVFMNIFLYVLTTEFKILNLFDKILLSKVHPQKCALSKCPHFVLPSLNFLYNVKMRNDYQN